MVIATPSATPCASAPAAATAASSFPETLLWRSPSDPEIQSPPQGSAPAAAPPVAGGLGLFPDGSGSWLLCGKLPDPSP